MIGHEHVQCIEPVGIVVTGTYSVVGFAWIVVPGIGPSVPFIGFRLQVLDAVNAVSPENRVWLCEDSVHYLAVVGAVEVNCLLSAVIHVLAIGDSVCSILPIALQRVGQSGHLESGIEDAELRHAREMFRQQTGVARYHRVYDVYDTVGNHRVWLENGCRLVDNHISRSTVSSEGHTEQGVHALAADAKVDSGNLSS